MLYLAFGLSILAVICAVWFFSQYKMMKNSFESNQSTLNSVQKEIATFREENILLTAEKNTLEQRLSDEKNRFQEHIKREKENANQQEQKLKESIHLMGENLVSKGSKILKSESESKLMEILQPLKEKIEKFEKEVRNNSEKSSERFSNMEGIVKTLSEQHEKMKSTAQNLVDALRGEQKTQGDWGEMALERILEMSGLEKGREYFTQSSFKDETGNHLRPDVVIQLPEEKHIIIDSKVSLKAFDEYINLTSPEEKTEALKRHLLSIRTHVKQLGEKNYDYLESIDTPDFVLMFIPLESSFALAMKEESNLYQQAWEKGVVLVTPSTLLATLKTVASIWKQEKQTRNVQEIARQAGAMYDKFVGFIGDLEKVGKKHQEANKALDDAMNKLSKGRGNLVVSTEKLKKLGAKVKGGKQIDEKYLEA